MRKTYILEDLDCAHCAGKIEEAVGKLEGVAKSTCTLLTQKLVVDVADEKAKESVEAQIKDWHRQQMYLACDDRVTILGHPWSCNRTWYEDFSIVPASMHDELAAALLENGKYAECNGSMFTARDTGDYFRNQYAEFLRFLFEKGIPITYGSDCHGKPDGCYPDNRMKAWYYLEKVGFKDGDFSELSDEKLWQ